ncbi:hypothetical protein ACFQ07_33985 [Actinomadura adrarensis]|uniref:Transposase n=1 Tax=Actinomadura adrarensis TaxID=1819600 RepID=A0ABW3CRX0_9ACTN
MTRATVHVLARLRNQGIVGDGGMAEFLEETLALAKRSRKAVRRELLGLNWKAWRALLPFGLPFCPASSGRQPPTTHPTRITGPGRANVTIRCGLSSTRQVRPRRPPP